MAWLSGSLTMPRDAGGPRAGGSRLQMPNIMRVLVPGGEAICLVGDAAVVVGGITATLPGGVPIPLDGGGVAMATTTTYYVSYVVAAAPGALRACRQQDWPAVYAAQDAAGIFYHTDHYDIRLPTPVSATIPGGIVPGYPPDLGLWFDDDSVPRHFSFAPGGRIRTAASPGVSIPIPEQDIPIPSGAGSYTLYCTPAGAITYDPTGAVRIMDITLGVRLERWIDRTNQSNTGDIYTVITAYDGAGTRIQPGTIANPVVLASGVTLPQASFHRPGVTPGDGVGFFIGVPPFGDPPGVTYVPFVSSLIGSIPNTASYADPLCALVLVVAASGVFTPSSPYAQASGIRGRVYFEYIQDHFNVPSNLLYYGSAPFGSHGTAPQLVFGYGAASSAWEGRDTAGFTAQQAIAYFYTSPTLVVDTYYTF